jgi:carboxymethylenebutenolidase
MTDTNTEAGQAVDAIVTGYRNQSLNRRAFLGKLIAATGSMAAAHLLLEKTGLAATLVSDTESKRANVASRTISYPGGSEKPVTAYLSAPEGKGPFPAIIVIHENRGLNDETRDVARRFAAEGFVALAPDLLSRVGGTDKMESPDAARTAIMAMDPADAIADLEAGLKYLAAQPNVDADQIGSVGFCWGGARSFTLATASKLLHACVVFYGSTPPLEDLPKVHCPVLGLYGGTDERITSKVPETAEAMKKAGKDYTYHIYPGAGHAFFNDTGANYNANAAKDAWPRTLTFLRKTLEVKG